MKSRLKFFYCQNSILFLFTTALYYLLTCLSLKEALEKQYNEAMYAPILTFYHQIMAQVLNIYPDNTQIQTNSRLRKEKVRGKTELCKTAN